MSFLRVSMVFSQTEIATTLATKLSRGSPEVPCPGMFISDTLATYQNLASALPAPFLAPGPTSGNLTQKPARVPSD